MIDYGICTREVVGLEDVGAESIRWDVFISAYNESERVQRVFERVRAKRKLWLVQREYGLESGQFPNGAFAADTRQEADFWRAFGVFAGAEWADGRVCVDITGFMRPQLVFLTVWLLAIKKKGFVAMYSDPIHYTQREETVFSKGPVTEVRQISGCEGIHDSNTGGDCLVIGMGYDDELVRRVAEAKDDARKIQLYGWPSLEPDSTRRACYVRLRRMKRLGNGAMSGALLRRTILLRRRGFFRNRCKWSGSRCSG